jgi:hypothetical protein
MKEIIQLALILVMMSPLKGQQFDWVKTIGSSGWDYARYTAVDDSGNVYTTGEFQGHVDFDPGPGVAHKTAAGGFDIFLQKLNSEGELVWVKTFGNSFREGFGELALDDDGNIYLIGDFLGTVDFDPNAGSLLLNAGSGNGTFILKLSSAGNLVWAKSLSSNGKCAGLGLAIDKEGKPIITGYFRGQVDFDPGPALSIHETESGGGDQFVLKLSPAGDFIWVKISRANPASISYSGAVAYTIAIDDSSNIYTVGDFRDTVDFDPSPSIHHLISEGRDNGFIQKLDKNGNLRWVKQVKTTLNTFNYSIAIDIGIDGANNVYVVGSYYADTVYFDSGNPAAMLTEEDSVQGFVEKLSSSGDFIWAKSIGGKYVDRILAVKVSESGNIYLTGHFSDTTNLDPDSIGQSFVSAGELDVFSKSWMLVVSYNGSRQLEGLVLISD